MSKKKNKLYKVDTKGFAPNEIMLYGSSNGWLKTLDSQGGETFLVPQNHTEADEPVAWCMLGKYSEMEVDDARSNK
jgi:hypothetical protein